MQKIVERFKKSLCRKLQFSQKSMIHRARQPFLQQNFVQQNQIVGCCYKPARRRPHGVRNGSKAAVPEKEAKIMRNVLDSQHWIFHKRKSSFLWYV